MGRLGPGAPRGMDQVFSEVFARESQLIRADPRNHTYIACAFLMRGNATISDVNRNLARIKPNLKMVHWNADGFKIGLCSAPPAGLPFSLLSLANNSCIAETFGAMHDRSGGPRFASKVPGVSPALPCLSGLACCTGARCTSTTTPSTSRRRPLMRHQKG